MKYHLLTLCLALSFGLMAQTPPSTTPPPTAINTGTSTGSSASTTFNTGNNTNTNTPPPTNDRTMGLGARLRAGLANNANLQASVANGTRRAAPTPSPTSAVEETNPATEDPPVVDENDPIMDDEVNYYVDYCTQAILAFDDGDYEVAAIYLELAADELDVTNEDDMLIFFEAAATVAYSLNYEEGDTETANELLTLANNKLAMYTELYPATEDNAGFYDEIGYVYYELDFNEDALRYFYASIQAYPDDSEIAYMVASTAALTGRAEEALSFLEYALQLGFYDDVLADETRDVDYISGDPDLESLVKYPKYQELKESYGF
jgi:tetratricopeptide (TPR) repeat protein